MINRKTLEKVRLGSPTWLPAKQNYQLDIQRQKKEKNLQQKAEDSNLQETVNADEADKVEADQGVADKADDEKEKYSEMLKFSFCCLIAASIQIYFLDI